MTDKQFRGVSSMTDNLSFAIEMFLKFRNLTNFNVLRVAKIALCGSFRNHNVPRFQESKRETMIVIRRDPVVFDFASALEASRTSSGDRPLSKIVR